MWPYVCVQDDGDTVYNKINTTVRNYYGHVCSLHITGGSCTFPDRHYSIGAITATNRTRSPSKHVQHPVVHKLAFTVTTVYEPCLLSFVKGMACHVRTVRTFPRGSCVF